MKAIIFSFFLFATSVLFAQSVGIGTTTPLPGYMLDVNGNLNSKGLRLNGPGNYFLMMDGNNSNKLFRWAATGGYLKNAYNSLAPFSSKTYMVIDSTGKVGIGESNPSTWFEVTNTTGNQLARFNGGNQMWITLAENNVNRGYLGSFSGNPEDIEFGTYNGNSTGKVHITTGNIPRLSVDASGNVGIGELPSSGNKLTVSGGDLVVKETGGTARIQLDSDQSDAIDFYKSGVHEHKIQSYGTALVLSRVGTFTEDLKLDNDGNFGVNASLADPVTKLQVYGTADASYANHGLMVLGSETGANVVYDQNEILARSNGSAADLFMQHDGGNLLLCGNEAGGVGIGLTAGSSIPVGSLLAVDGKITCEEVLVKMSQNWPDYVFADDYKLPELSDVKKFIEKNKHLPGIPKAVDIEKDGLELGAIQRKMMEKIEELTIYIIQMEEKVRSLELKIKNEK